MTAHSKKWMLSAVALILIMVLSACGTNAQPESSNKGNSGNTEASASPEAASEKIIYRGEEGDIEFSEYPKKVAMLTNTYAGNLLALGITPVAINEYPKENKFYEGKLDEVEVITADNVEKLVEIDPDVIVTYTGDKNISKYKEIAPTVVMSYDKYDYKQQHLEIGKLVGMEAEAQAWIDEWETKAAAAKETVFKVVSPDATVSIMESYGKDTYIYFKNGSRGTEILYQVLGMKTPPSLKIEENGPPYKAISSESIGEYAGDYVFMGEGGSTTKNSFMDTDVWKGLPAVKNNQVIGFDATSFAYNDPISLEKELTYIVKALTEQK
ncbi:ABC transporter substrate-binding protein [Paenibacillus sp. FSL A5-0031]|uniref:ABC transporter substrate-binding protein n=1 Tax=Paenibacillus sp. FSL A5-0031 TaxID=1920420 RepID=UPI00211712D2|nr:ABC transporter substrate-binding protein [Paenibacillus sp. FSL A5-0031]